jgi:zinc transport system substrate-binding protein
MALAVLFSATYVLALEIDQGEGHISAISQKPLIITTIKPLAIIAKSAVGDSARVEYLQSAVQSAHEVSLPVSALMKLEQAALIIWIGGGFEARISKSMALLPKAKLITVTELKMLSANHAAEEVAKRTENKSNYSGKAHGGEASNDTNSDSEHHQLDFDPHIWLNPANGNILANHIQQRLNLALTPIMSSAQIEQLKAELQPLKVKDYLNHHDAFAHFAAAFDLKAGLSIRDAKGATQGAKSQYKLRQQARLVNASCIFVEPQYADKDAKIIARELQLPLKILDPQGFDQPLTANAYSEFMTAMVTQFKACFD